MPKTPSEASVRLVRAFVALANTKSTAKAAKQLDIRPEALQGRIRTLERVCGLELVRIEQPNSQVVLTEDGLDRLSSAMTMVRAHDMMLLGRRYRNEETDEKVAAIMLAETMVKLLHRDLNGDLQERLQNFLRDFVKI